MSLISNSTSQLEIERKWIIEGLGFLHVSSLVSHTKNYTELFQAYINDVRYRMAHKINLSEDDGATHPVSYCEKTTKTGCGLVRTETNTPITKADAMSAVAAAGLPWMFKQRYEIQHANHVIEVDFYFDHDDNIIMSTAEVEFKSEEQAYEFDKHIPEWFGDEVTGIDEYSAHGIYRNSYLSAVN